MKVIARGMGISGYSASAATPQNQSNTFSAKSPSLFNHEADDHLHGAFKFVALAKPEMGNMFRGEGSRNSRNYHRGEKGGSHQSFEMVHP